MALPTTWITGVALLFLVYSVTGQLVPSICGDNSEVGDSITTLRNTDDLAESARFYVGAGTTAWSEQFSSIGCYGVVKSFQFRCRTGRTPASGSVGFAVWRPDGANYYLLGEYVKTFECTDENAIMVTDDRHEWEQIPVKPGDRIAIHTKDDDSRLQLSTATCGSCDWYYYGNNMLADYFHTATTTGVTPVDDIRFSVRAILGPGIIPSIDNLDHTIYVKETETPTKELYTVEVSDENRESIIDLSQYAGDDLVFGPFGPYTGFSMDLTTGVISMTNALDYETQDVHYLEVVVHDGGTTGDPDGLSFTGTLTVSVIDVNETHTSLNIPATENIITVDYPIGTTVFTVEVTADNDGHLLAPYTYVIESQTEFGLFEIDSTTGAVYPTQDLSTYTSTPQHDLHISATDGGTFQFGTQILTIIINDDNTPPVLDNPSFAVSISEDTLIGYDIFSFEPIDNDADTVTFSIVDYDPPIGETIFELSADGIITLVDNPGLDFETQNTYDINVEYTDGLHTLTQTVTVTITDVNEPPYFVTTYYEDTYNDQIDPQNPPPTVPHVFGFTLNAVDPDGDAVEYVIEGGYGSDQFYINVDEMETIQSIIMQDLWSYDFLIKMRVRDVNGLYGDTALVNISWINIDDPHSMSDTTPSTTINCQDTYAGDEIFDIEALVTGEEFFDHFTYVLNSISPDNGYLELDPVTGIVSASKSFRDWEFDGATSAYTLSITATDRDGHTATTTLTVDITNFKSKPVWDNLDETISIAETIDGDEEVYEVVASDVDDDTILAYTMTSYSPMEAIDKFVFDSATGILKTRPSHTLSEDYESGSTQYVFTFTARDFLHTSDVGTLTVDIDGINEAPSFVITEYYATTLEAAVDGTALTVIPSWSVTDPEGGGYIYSELSGPYSQYFDVTGGGQVEATATPTDCDEQQPTDMYLEIRVSDGALTDKAMLYIEVECINDRGVFFQQDQYAGTVQENTYGGASLLEVSATDKDYPAEHSTITYSIDGFYVDNQTVLGDLFFEVDPQTGVISVAHQVNFESYTFIQFTVRASDGFFYDLALVNITITDSNDIRPMFIDNFQNTEMPSYTEIGTYVATVAAYDNDTGNFGNLKYFFLMEENYDYFTIDENTGVISVHQPLEPDITYIIYVFAQDKDTDNPQISTSSIIRLDSYSGWKFLIDIHVSLTVDEMILRQEEFIYAINATISPWFCRIQEIRAGDEEAEGLALTRNLLAEDGKSIVTIYGLEDNLADQQTYIDIHKSFVYRDHMLDKLRQNLYSDPSDELLANPLVEDFGITKVEPTYPIWWIDTVGGVATLGVLAFLFGAIILTAVLLGCWKYKLACFAYCDRQPEPVLNNKPRSPPPPSGAQIFDFNYHQYDDDKTPEKLDKGPSPYIPPTARTNTPSDVTLQEKPINTNPPGRTSKARIGSASTIHTQIVPKYSNYGNNNTTYNMGYKLDD